MSGTEAPGARVMLQQCLGASLMVKPAEDGGPEAEYVQIDKGMVVYVCFFKGATLELLPKIVSSVLGLRLCESSSGTRVSVLDLPGSLLIVPQASLGGKAKGKSLQYHQNVDKEDGLRLYEAFVGLCQKQLSSRDVTVRHGTYGNRQVLRLDTNGPYTHVLDF